MTAFEALFVPADLRQAVSSRSWLLAMLETERALAAAGAVVGLVPDASAEAIAAACADADGYSWDELLDQGRAVGNPAEPLVRVLRARVGDEHERFVHLGATSQDVLDTAAMLVSRNAVALVLSHADAAAETCATLAREHRSTPMAARTLVQQAVPTTFGLVAAGWLVALLDARRRLADLAETGLAVQLGGAAGTLSALGDEGMRTVEALAGELGLAVPTLPWHTNRVRVAGLGAALATLAGVCGKIGLDVVQLSQTEVAEVREAKGGGSSAMPHKRNPVAAICALACAQQAPGLAATLLGAMAQEHERAAGAWHAEWRPLGELLRSTGSAVAWLRDSLEGLEVDPERMRANLEATGGRIMAERLKGELAEADLERALESEDFRAAVEDLGAGDLLDPAAYLGSAGELVDRALDFYDREG